MTVGLLPGCRLGFVPGGGGARLGLRVSGCHNVGSHMPRLLDSIIPSFCTFVP